MGGGNSSHSFWLRGQSQRRRDLLELLDRLNPTIAELSQAVEQESQKVSRRRSD